MSLQTLHPVPRNATTFGNLVLWEAHVEKHLLVGRHLDLALLADLTRETLGQHEVDRSGHQERLDAHVQQTGDRARRVVGVERRQDQVTRQRGLDGNLRGLEVSNLTDHDDVGVLTQERAQCRGEVQADVFVHLHLVDADEVELDRILGGADVRSTSFSPTSRSRASWSYPNRSAR